MMGVFHNQEWAKLAPPARLEELTKTGGVVAIKNRLLVCPECGTKLSSDKNALTTREGNILRERVCSYCQAVYFTRQEPERVTRVVSGV